MNKRESAELTVEECFWGDYKLGAEELLAGIEAKDEAFCLFVLSKIIDNARHPSRILRTLFDSSVLRSALEGLAYIPGSRREKRIMLIRTNLFGEKHVFEELSWSR